MHLENHRIEHARGRCSDTKKETLNISFHNPNTSEAFVREMVQISAELAKSSINQKLLHMEKEEGQAI